MNIHKSIDTLIGRTPLVELSGIEKHFGLDARLFAKAEYVNPTGSVKDRAALNMINDAENRGLIKTGSTIIEPTSGNTGIGLAAIAAARGYRCIIVMPDTMSEERIKLMKAYGAEVVLTDGKSGMGGSIKKAEELKAENESAFIPMQFENEANSNAHYLTTAPEIWDDLDGRVDAFAAGVGTGGTLCGCARFFKEKNENIKIYGIEPESSPLISLGKSGAHKLQGIGANFIPKLFDKELTDGILTVGDDEAYEYAKLLAKKEGLFCGITSGAALAVGVRLAMKKDFSGKNIVILLPDGGSRYISTVGFID